MRGVMTEVTTRSWAERTPDACAKFAAPACVAPFHDGFDFAVYPTDARTRSTSSASPARNSSSRKGLKPKAQFAHQIRVFERELRATRHGHVIDKLPRVRLKTRSAAPTHHVSLVRPVRRRTAMPAEQHKARDPRYQADGGLMGRRSSSGPGRRPRRPRPGSEARRWSTAASPGRSRGTGRGSCRAFVAPPVEESTYSRPQDVTSGDAPVTTPSSISSVRLVAPTRTRGPCSQWARKLATRVGDAPVDAARQGDGGRRSLSGYTWRRPPCQDLHTDLGLRDRRDRRQDGAPRQGLNQRRESPAARWYGQAWQASGGRA